MQLRTTHRWVSFVSYRYAIIAKMFRILQRDPSFLRSTTLGLLLLLIVQSHGGAWRQVRGDESATSGGDVSCSDLFTLDTEQYYQKRYEGTLLVTSPVTVKDIQLELRFDRDVDLLVVSSARVSRVFIALFTAPCCY